MAQLERYEPHIAGRIRYEHFHRYAFAAEFVAGATVLDIACGEGYGSAVLSRLAKRVVGVDVDAATVAEANRRYAAGSRLAYVVGEAGAIPFGDASFDVVVSMETIEHLQKPERLIEEVRRVLRPGGLLILSSPDKEVYNRGRSTQNIHHFCELEAIEFASLLGSHFENSRLFGQRMILASSIGETAEEKGRAQVTGYGGFTAERVSQGDFRISPGVVRPRSPEYLIGLASDGALPVPSARHSIFMMRDDDLWDEHARVMRWASGLHEEDEVLRSRVKDLETKLDSKNKDEILASTQTQLDQLRERAEAQAHEIRQLSQGRNTVDWQIISSVLTSVEGCSVSADAASVLQALTQLAIDSIVGQRRIADLEASLASRIADCEVLQRAVDTTSQAIALHAELQTEARQTETALRRRLEENERALETERAEHAERIADAVRAQDDADGLRKAVAALRRKLEENDAELLASQQLTRQAARSVDQTETLEQQAAALRRACEVAASEHRRYADHMSRARETVRLLPRPQREAVVVNFTSRRLRAFRRSGLFLDDYYAKEAGLKDPTKAWANFCRRGCKADVSCNPLLWTHWLAEHVPDLPVRSAAYVAVTAPLIFEDVMHPLFDPGYYVEANGIDLPAGVSPLSHYMNEGRAAGLSPHPLIDTAHLRAARPEDAPFDLVRYVSEPSLYRLPVHPLFDSIHYLETNPDVAASGMNPLTHYVAYGWRENRAPNPLFDNFWYISDNPDVGEAGQVPLAHYARFGAAEGRTPHPLFDPSFYLRTYGDIAEADRPPYAHFLQYGWSEGRAPSSAIAAIANAYPDWTRTRILDDVLAGRMDMSELMRALPAPTSLHGWSRDGDHSYHLPQRLRDYIIERYGEDSIDLYLDLFAVIDLYQDRTDAFDTGREIEKIAERIKTLAVTQGYFAPAVSIIVPVYNNLVYTLTCLLSVLETSTAHSFEIIVADDVSSDRTAEIIGGIGGRVRHLRHEKNLGFLHNCNAAAEAAAGRYLVFLNNDTVVLPGWLDNLITPMEIDPTTGLTGSKLLNGDGTLQEAGGIFWRDGSAWNFGRGQEPWLPEFNYAKDVDYISGASIALPAALWQELGGFDPLFTPAYCEDSDIAFRVRAKGYRTRYQPHSMLVHHEGRSHGRDVTSGIKAYQVANQAKLLGRWSKTLERDHEQNAQNVFLARDRSRGKPHILVVDHYVPQWDRDAGSRTMYAYLRLFAESGFAVTFWSDNLHEDREYTVPLQKMGIEVIYSHAYIDRFPSWLKYNGKYLDYVFLSRPHIAVKYIEEFANFENIKKIYYGHDLHFKRLRQEHKLKGEPSLLVEAEKLEDLEMRLCRGSDIVLYPSLEEINAIRDRLPANVVAFAIPMVVFSNAELTSSEARIAECVNRDPFKLMFIGGFSHHPNVDGILWFVNEVFPLLRAVDRRFHLTIAGSNAPNSVYELANIDIDVLGKISDQELQNLYRSSGMAVVPLRYGAGVKGKVIEAMVHGVPVAMTEVGAQGIPPAEQIGFVGTTPKALADAIIRAANDPLEANMRARRALEFLRAAYSESAVRDLMATVVPELATNSSVVIKESAA